MASPGDFDPRSLFDMTGKGVLVVGAGQGIGAQSSRILAAFGANLVCVDLDQDAAAGIAKETGGTPLVADVTKEDEVLRVLDKAEAELGRIDGMLDIVGGSLFKPIAEMEMAEWDGQFDRNLRHTYLIGRHLGMRQAAGGGGSLVFIASVAAFYGGRLHAAYGASKAALVAWVKALAQEFGPQGVRVNAIAPGATWTPRNRARWDADLQAQTERATLLHKIGEDYHIGATALYLLAESGGNTTGQTLIVDGGTTSLEPYLSQGQGYDEMSADSKRNQATVPGERDK